MSIDTKEKENIYFNLRGLNIEFQLSDEFSSESARAGKTSTAESKLCKPRLTEESAISAINLKTHTKRANQIRLEAPKWG